MNPMEDEIFIKIVKRNAEIKELVKPFSDEVIRTFIEKFDDMNDADFEYAEICLTNAINMELFEYKHKRKDERRNRMSKYRMPNKNELVSVADGMTVGLPIGTKAWVKYDDTSSGKTLKIATVIETEDGKRVFDNGYGNPIFGIEWYALAEQMKVENEKMKGKTE